MAAVFLVETKPTISAKRPTPSLDRIRISCLGVAPHAASWSVGDMVWVGIPRLMRSRRTSDARCGDEVANTGQPSETKPSVSNRPRRNAARTGAGERHTTSGTGVVEAGSFVSPFAAIRRESLEEWKLRALDASGLVVRRCKETCVPTKRWAVSSETVRSRSLSVLVTCQLNDWATSSLMMHPSPCMRPSHRAKSSVMCVGSSESCSS